MSLRAALVLSIFLHLAVLTAVNHPTVAARRVVLRLPSNVMNVDMVRAGRPAKTPIPAQSSAVAAIAPEEGERSAPPAEKKGGAAPSRLAAPEAAAPPNPSGGFSAPGAPAQPPDALSRAMTPLMYSQWLTGTAMRYFKTTHALVLAQLETALAGDLLRELDGEEATIVAVYAEKNNLKSLTVEAKNETLRKMLETGLSWQTLPAPGSLFLPYREITFQVSLEKGKINLRLSPSSGRPAP